MGEAFPNRTHPRLPGRDYSAAGWYFLTLCATGRRCLFGSVVGRGILDAPPEVVLSPAGDAVEHALRYLDGHCPGVRVDAVCIMPNHVHLIVRVVDSGASGRPRPTDALIPKFVSSLKRYTNKVCGQKLWQTSYYDHIICDEADYLRVRQYMDNNPARWAEDKYHV